MTGDCQECASVDSELLQYFLYYTGCKKHAEYKQEPFIYQNHSVQCSLVVVFVFGLSFGGFFFLIHFCFCKPATSGEPRIACW